MMMIVLCLLATVGAFTLLVGSVVVVCMVHDTWETQKRNLQTLKADTKQDLEVLYERVKKLEQHCWGPPSRGS